jgi:hypothetical protein
MPPSSPASPPAHAQGSSGSASSPSASQRPPRAAQPTSSACVGHGLGVAGDIHSGAPESAAASESGAAQDHVVTPVRPRTMLQSGIVKPKVYTDGTIRYANLCTTGEPDNLTEALSSPQ